jgi:Ser/Thr protein kinase RdoA (MazF antagonist)
VSHPGLSAENLALRDRLLRRLERLQGEQDLRAATIAELGGVETLVHGDLWTKNVMVLAPDRDGRRSALLIDWDHVGVGPVAYDLSVLLLRFDRDRRPWVLDLYRAAVEREAGWRLPDSDRMNQMFKTCELARLANSLLWPAISASEPSGAWAFETMAEIERWFESLQPVLP